MSFHLHTREYTKLHCELFNHYRQEVIHHKTKIKFFISLYVSFSSAILVMQKDYIFKIDNGQIDWILLAASSILIFSVYSGLCFHSIRVLTMSANRDHCEWHIRKLIGHSINADDVEMEKKLIWYNLPAIGSPIGIFVVELLFIATLYSFFYNIFILANDEQRTIIDIGKAFTIIYSLSGAWFLITIVSILSYYSRFKAYLFVARKLNQVRRNMASENDSGTDTHMYPDNTQMYVPPGSGSQQVQ